MSSIQGHNAVVYSIITDTSFLGCEEYHVALKIKYCTIIQINKEDKYLLLL